MYLGRNKFITRSKASTFTRLGVGEPRKTCSVACLSVIGNNRDDLGQAAGLVSLMAAKFSDVLPATG